MEVIGKSGWFRYKTTEQYVTEEKLADLKKEYKKKGSDKKSLTKKKDELMKELKKHKEAKDKKVLIRKNIIDKQIAALKKELATASERGKAKIRGRLKRFGDELRQLKPHIPRKKLVKRRGQTMSTHATISISAQPIKKTSKATASKRSSTSNVQLDALYKQLGGKKPLKEQQKIRDKIAALKEKLGIETATASTGTKPVAKRRTRPRAKASTNAGRKSTSGSIKAQIDKLVLQLEGKKPRAEQERIRNKIADLEART